MRDEDGIGLDEALEVLRSELACAHREAADTDLQFPIESLTVELKAGATKSKDGKLGFKIPFIDVELGGSTGYDRESLQTITLVLGSPIDAQGNPVKVAHRGDQRKE